MSDRTGQSTEPIGRRVGARVRQPNRTLDLKAVKLEIICLKKNLRSGDASAVTAKSNEIISLISDDRNLHEVKEKLIHLNNALQRLREAHNDYSIEILDEDGIAECQLNLKWGSKIWLILQIADWIIATEEKLPAESLGVDSIGKTWSLGTSCWDTRTSKGIDSL